MSTLDIYRGIYEASFRRQRAGRTQWFFERFLRSDDDVRVDAEGKAGMIARAYPFVFHEREVTLLNISRATTVPGERGKGLMSTLMGDVLREAAARGVAFASLTPPTRRLYFFFDRFGFATAGFVAEERYTDLHHFATSERTEGCEPSGALMRALAAKRGMAAMLSDADFKLLCEQIELDDGRVIAAMADGSPELGAILFAGRTDAGEGISVHALLGEDREAIEAALAGLRKDTGEGLAICVRSDAEGAPRGRLRVGAMLRIVDALTVLDAVAASSPELKLTIRLHDDIVEQNNAVFRLRGGKAERTTDEERRPDLDVRVQTLVAILFSEPHVGEIFELPAQRLAPLILPG